MNFMSLGRVLACSLLFASPVTVTAQANPRADTVVKLAQRPLYPGIAALVEELSIGVADGSEEYMLGEIADVALGRDGSIYALDRQVPAIRHYDAHGKFIRNIGRRGQGPGEFRSMSGIALARDGRLLLWDTGNWRINVYSPTGDILPQITTPSGSSGSSVSTYSRALMVDTAGRIVTRKFVFSRDMKERPTVWLRFMPDGNPIDTIHAPASRYEVATVSATSGRFSVTNDVPFAPKRFVAMSPLGSMIAGFPNRYAFEIHQPGRPVVSVRRDVKPELVSRSERSEARKEIEDRMRKTDPTWSWNGPDIPDTKPLYHDLQVALDGRIWVPIIPEVSARVGSISSGGGGVGPATNRPRIEGPPPPPPRPALYDVFEPDGQYVGQVQVPARVSSVVRRGDHVWAVAVDEHDVPRLKRYRIAWKN
jgi:hypothetical protein